MGALKMPEPEHIGVNQLTVKEKLGMNKNRHKIKGIKGINSVIKRQAQKHKTIVSVIMEIENNVKNQEKQIELSLLGQGEWEIAPEYQEFTIQEDSFYLMTPKQRQNLLKKFNSQNPKQKTSEYMSLQISNSIKDKKKSISPSESGIIYPPITVLINTLFEIGKKIHSSAKDLQSNLYQLKIIIIRK